MHLHEVLNMSIQDYELERKRIETLFEHTKIIHFGGFYEVPSLRVGVAKTFMSTKLRGTFVSIDDFFKGCERFWAKPSLESLLFYCETVYNVLSACNDGINMLGEQAVAVKRLIFSNVNIILEKTGYVLTELENGSGLWEIVKKDALVSAVVEDLPDADAALAVLDYNHFKIKGDITKKRELLVAIGRYVEPLMEEPELKGSHCGLVDDVKFCLNNLHIRHNNEAGKHAKEFVEKMPDEELEQWYDNAYRSMLLLIEERKQLETHKEIDALKKSLKK